VNQCRSCKQPIIWAITANGKATPVDPQPSLKGNLLLTYDGNGGGYRASVATSVDPASPRYVSHFATCPTARLHRRRGRS
jgi:hypothetical protein